jgi:hypothetical protein
MGIAIFRLRQRWRSRSAARKGPPDDFVEMHNARVKYKEPLVLFANNGGEFKNVSQKSGAVFQPRLLGTWNGYGDFDNDGDLDVLVSTMAKRRCCFATMVVIKNNWLGLTWWRKIATLQQSGQ